MKLKNFLTEQSNSELSNIVDDFIKHSGVGSKFWDEKYGINKVNAAIRYGLDKKLIRLSAKGNPMIVSPTEYGFKSALRHRSFSISKY